MTDQEQGDAGRVKATLDRLGRRLVDEADGLCRERIAEFDRELDKARTLVTKDGTAAAQVVAAVKPAIASLLGQAAAPAVAEASASHATLRIASKPIIALLSPSGALVRKAESIDGMLASRRKFREAVQELDRRLGNWSPYADQLEALARDFTEFPEARDYARAAESKVQWPAVDAWRAFQPSLQQLHLATPERAQETIKKFEALPQETKNLPMAQRIVQEVMPAIKQLAARDLAKLRTDLGSWFSGTWVGELKFVVKTDAGTAYYCLDNQQQDATKFTYVSGRKDAETGWPTKDERKPVATVEQSPLSRLADTLRAAVRKADPKGGVAVDQLFVTMIEGVIAAEDVDPVPRLVTARKLLLLAAEYSRPCREAGQPLMPLLDDGDGNIPGVTIDQLWSFVPPTRERDTVYMVTREKSEAILNDIKSGLAAMKAAIAKEQNVLMAPPMGSAKLAGRLGRNDAGDMVAVWQGAAPSPGQVWWFPARAEAAVAGTVDAKGMFRPGPAPGPAGTPLFTMAGNSKGTTKTDLPAAGREE